MDVIASCRTGFETYGVRDGERGSFRFRLPDLARGAAAAIATMQEFMRLCCAQHKRIYVAVKFMWRSASTAAGNGEIRVDKRHIITVLDLANFRTLSG